jgi:acyl-CoA reductase-like NAD-dependent aldehyde dehydrogenase
MYAARKLRKLLKTRKKKYLREGDNTKVKKVAPALAAGNSVVIKPSELAPNAILELARLCTEAGLPPGVLGVVLGDGPTGAQLIANPKVRKVDFTGGPRTGKAIGLIAGENLCGSERKSN